MFHSFVYKNMSDDLKNNKQVRERVSFLIITISELIGIGNGIRKNVKLSSIRIRIILSIVLITKYIFTFNLF